MQKRILISVDTHEVQVAVFENATLAEYFVERNSAQRMVGNIYKGKIDSIIPGIDAAFVNIGLSRNAFLYVADVLSAHNGYEELFDEGGDEDGEPLEGGEPRHTPPMAIDDLLEPGQEILVQMRKEPIGDKGSRVTTHLTLPGRFLVLLPNTTHVGVSRKIEDEAERERLRGLAEALTGGHCGLIVRTVACGVDEEQLAADYRFLMQQLEEIRRRFETQRAPSLLHRDLTLLQRVVRDIFSPEVSEFVVDDVQAYQEVVEFARRAVPALVERITLYEKTVPLFVAAGVDNEIRQLLRRRVWLPCGGYIVIDENEALTAIDVNTGRYLGKHNLEETVYYANLEAAAEIARQVRLRDIGGIIVIDFIDMRDESHRRGVLEKLESHLRRDRSRVQITEITSLGLVQMTRKRVRQSLSRALRQPCPYCRGDGTILSLETVAIQVMRRIKERLRASPARALEVVIHPQVARHIGEAFRDELERMAAAAGVRLTVRGNANLHFEEIDEGEAASKDQPHAISLPGQESDGNEATWAGARGSDER